MRHDTTDHTISIFASSAIFMDGCLPSPLIVGDIVSVSLSFDVDVAQSTAGIETLDVTVHPEYGVAPGLYPDLTLRWPHKVTGDGWTAKWIHEQPFAGRLRVPARLWPQFIRAVPGHPETTTGRVRRLQLVEERYENTPEGKRRVPGTERVSDLGSSTDSEMPRWTIIPTDDLYQPTGIVVDLDLDDVPGVPGVPRSFNAGAVSVNGADVWVIDKSHPALVHIDTGPTPHRVTEYLLPLMVNTPTKMWTRQVHADPGGCWITSGDEIVRCNRDGPTELTLRRATTDGGHYTVALDGRVFAMTHPLHSEERDVEPARRPVRELIDDELIPVTDEPTIARARAASGRADFTTTPEGTTWTANGNITVQATDEDPQPVDLQPRTEGQVNWVRPRAWSGKGIDQIAPGSYAPLSGKPSHE